MAKVSSRKHDYTGLKARSMARRILRRTISKDRFPATARQQEMRHALQFLRISLIGPQEHPLGLRPKLGKRLLRLESVGRIGKFLSVPEIAAGGVQHANRHVSIEIEG